MLLACLLLPARAALAQQPPSGGQLAQDFMERVARVVGRLPVGAGPQATGGETGYAFIVGEHQTALGLPGLLLLTADHLVRDPANPNARFAPPRLTFYGDLAQTVQADVLEPHLPPEDGDLAVLVVPRPTIARFTKITAVDPLSLLPGMAAWQVGRPGLWEPNTIPGQFALRATSGWLSFSGLDASPGSAGAPVLTNQGLAGLLVGADPRNSGNARVLPMDLIAAKLHEWGMQWLVSAPATPAAAGPAVATSLSDVTGQRGGAHTTSILPETAAPAAPAQQQAAIAPLPGLPPPPLQVVPMLASERAARTSWVPPGARISPWSESSAALMAAPSRDSARIGSMPPGTELPLELWLRGAYAILDKLDNGGWFLAGTEGQPVGYVAGDSVIEIWPAPPQNEPAIGKIVRDWIVDGTNHATLRDAGTHYELTVPLTCKLEFCDTVMAYTPKPPARGAIMPTLSVPAITGSWQQNSVAEIRLQLPRPVVETKGTRLLGCIGRADDCAEQTLLTGG